ncbi:ribokinase [Dyadobacter tibetensis]|uniref:ribokinase n=1 Tax=Dyadobacter tibetensis TaxID=1211851 RepID=UPI000470B8DD|nr:ribokinase [Dyadobacter tibetensis]
MENRKKILVIGSSNTDMVVQTSHFPKPGQTVLGGKFMMNAGGKGANQAVAAARLDGLVRLIAKLGQDIFATEALSGFRKEGIDITYLRQTFEYASGVALITVAENGENEIVVASGANMDLKPADISNEAFEEVGLVMMQCEIPLETISYVADICSRKGIPVLLNPAPATSLPESLLSRLFMITPNETETEVMTGIYPGNPKDMERAAHWFLNQGVQNVLITLGKQGVYWQNKTQKGMVPAVQVQAVDTTGAGDVFNGALAQAVVEGCSLPAACQFAVKAAAIAVTRLGAQTAAPFRNEIV